MSVYDRTVASWPNDMTLRDYFAAKAMQGMLAAGEGVPSEKLAKWAYDVADAMLAAREAK